MGKPGKMEMKCYGMTLLVINIVLFLLGLALLIVGFVFRAKTDVFRGDDVMEVLNDVNVSGSRKLGDAVNKIHLYSIYHGAVIILNSCLGAYWACCKKRGILLLYMGFCIAHLIYLIVCLTPMGTLIHTIREETTMKAELTTALVKYKGYENSVWPLVKYIGYDNSLRHTKSSGWNLIFIDLECCGVDTVSASNDEFSASDWASTRGTKKIPVSCCKSATKANYTTHTDTACTDAYTDYNTKDSFPG